MVSPALSSCCSPCPALAAAGCGSCRMGLEGGGMPCAGFAYLPHWSCTPLMVCFAFVLVSICFSPCMSPGAALVAHRPDGGRGCWSAAVAIAEGMSVCVDGCWEGGREQAVQGPACQQGLHEQCLNSSFSPPEPFQSLCSSIT